MGPAGDARAFGRVGRPGPHAREGRVLGLGRPSRRRREQSFGRRAPRPLAGDERTESAPQALAIGGGEREEGVESPPEEKKARMAYQMKRLVEGMGSGPGDSRERLLEAINRFIALRPPAAELDPGAGRARAIVS